MHYVRDSALSYQMCHNSNDTGIISNEKVETQRPNYFPRVMETEDNRNELNHTEPECLSKISSYASCQRPPISALANYKS